MYDLATGPCFRKQLCQHGAKSFFATVQSYYKWGSIETGGFQHRVRCETFFETYKHIFVVFRPHIFQPDPAKSHSVGCFASILGEISAANKICEGLNYFCVSLDEVAGVACESQET